jgi:anti-sigma regulatory factor (Ser/Thr protein kinase)
MTVAPRTEIVLDSRFEETRRLAPWLASVLGDVRSGTAADDLELALVELVNNIVLHGHGSEPGHPIRLRLEQEEGIVRVEIRDRGRPVPAEAFSPAGAFSFDPEDLDSLPVDGMGMALVQSVVDHLEYGMDGEDNVTLVVKDLDHAFWCKRADVG